MTVQNKGTYKDKLQIYIPAGKKQLIKEVRAILKKDGSSISKLILEQLESYYRLHEPGNPQQRLDTIMKLGKAYHAPSKICGFKDCLRDAVAVGLFIPKNTTYGLCRVHLKEAKENLKLWKLVKP